MRIVFAGGGTGGHFYPIIAVAEAVHHIVDQEKILGLKMYYFADSQYDKSALFENQISYRYVTAGKIRVYFSPKNFFDVFKTILGFFSALVDLFFLYPDVVFSKGGYGSFPVVLAARILRIPVVIHESDTVPGKANAWTGKFARNIAVSYDEAARYFIKKERVAVTGQPIRNALKEIKKEGAFEYLNLEPSIPTILILGGSQGSEMINNTIVDMLPELLKNYQIIHQTGREHFDEMKARATFLLKDNEYANRYAPFASLNPLAMRMAAGASSLVISRAGSTLFEIAGWSLPSIIIPIPATNSRNDHQRKNAFNYARHGAATVIEESNLSQSILTAEIQRMFTDTERTQKMREAAKAFSTPDAAEKIARVLVDIGLEHEN